MRLVRNSNKLSKLTLEKFKQNSANIYEKDSAKYSETLALTILHSIDEAKKSGLKNIHLLWLTREIFQRNLKQGIIDEDYIPVLKIYVNNEKLVKEGKLKNINEYEDISSLGADIRELANFTGFVSEDDFGILLEIGDWVLSLPKTKEASILLGKHTDWCTSRTESNNLFGDYTEDPKRKLILFYVFNKKANTRKDPNGKLSIAFVNGRIVWLAPKNLTVNSSNIDISKNDFISIVGKETAESLIARMRKEVKLSNAEHPQRTETRKKALDYDHFISHLETLKTKKEMVEFLEKVAGFEIDERVAEFIISEYRKSTDISRAFYILSENPSISEKIVKTIMDLQSKSAILKNEGITEKQVFYFFENRTIDDADLADISKSKIIYENINVQKLILSIRFKSSYGSVIDGVFAYSNVWLRDIFQFLKTTKSEEVMSLSLTKGKNELAELLVKNPNMTKLIKHKIMHHPAIDGPEILASSPHIDEKDALEIIRYSEVSSKYKPIEILAKNPVISNQILAEIWKIGPFYQNTILKNPRIKNKIITFVSSYLNKE